MVESIIGIRGKDFVLLAQDANTTKYGILNMKFDTNRMTVKTLMETHAKYAEISLKKIQNKVVSNIFTFVSLVCLTNSFQIIRLICNSCLLTIE